MQRKYTLTGLLESRTALSNSYSNSCVSSREAICTIFMMFFCMIRGANPHPTA